MEIRVFVFNGDLMDYMFPLLKWAGARGLPLLFVSVTKAIL